MKIRPWLIFFKDLFDVLPSRARPEWEDYKNITADKPTVILVSGFAANGRTLSVIRKRLLRDGFNVIVLALEWQTLSDSVRGLYRMAGQLSSTVLRLRKQAGMRKSKIFIVAHSAGGLVARHYVQILGGSHYCEALITLATPHRGTWVAGLGLMTHLILKARCLFEMLPISPFVKTLNHASFPVGFRLISIFSPDDLLCPRRTTRLPAEWKDRGEIQSIEISDLSHSDFLLSKECYQTLLAQLNAVLQLPPAGRASQPAPGVA